MNQGPEVVIEPMRELSDGVIALAAVARSEGYRNIDTLIGEYRSGLNCFAKPGEGLFGAHKGSQLLAVGGLNIDPHEASKKVARVRRVYVHPESRRLGVASMLMREIEALAAQNFSRIQLYTTSVAASDFYISHGYRTVLNRHKVSHEKRLE